MKLRAGDEDPAFDLLTPRERQVLRLIARGYSCPDISPKTVESHVSCALRNYKFPTAPTLALGVGAAPH